MRFAAIADIHGNALALEAVLADIASQGIATPEIVNLGDCLSGPLEAGRTADILLPLNLLTVCGNHDRYLIEHAAGDMHEWEADAYAQLSPAHLDWLKSLPSVAVFRDVAYLCHATPQNDNTYWLEQVSSQGHVHLRDRAVIEEWAAGITHLLILCGHTHIPRAVQLSDGRLIVNPGSVGGPGYTDDAPHPHKVEAGLPHASYAILDNASGDWAVTFRLVPYDNMAMSRLAAARKRPEWARALASGFVDV
ncbi:metallophosphoesterase [Rhizobium sp. Root274]|uniref:metallophosphoesterase family protein n=1 Tax=unclassified Rhizobium TaxID=2613769 RepID=UPI0007151F35|nr:MULTISPECIES: metallophosphoesterase family protein [unclassified Rhizobium]KQW29113.1 metallophosphoesterase [Rhizobium sp. Root1240]KRD29309.1 metallophosphoesterase [Rhizobium sp. Root274]